MYHYQYCMKSIRFFTLIFVLPFVYKFTMGSLGILLVSYREEDFYGEQVKKKSLNTGKLLRYLCDVLERGGNLQPSFSSLRGCG